MAPKLQTKQRLITIFLLLTAAVAVQAGLRYGQTKSFVASKQEVFSKRTPPYLVLPDTVKKLPPDTLKAHLNDSISAQHDTASNKSNKFTLAAKIDYASADSLSMDIQGKKAWLYGHASIQYQDIKLDAAIIEIDFEKNTIHAYAAKDSVGNPIGTPEFKQGELSFKSKEMAYNFTTKKGLIQNVITKEGDGYIHGTVIKKVNDSVTDVGRGEYTTCDLDEHPHFSLKFTKAKVMTGRMIVTGPAYITVEDVPLPLALPFGLFPNKKGRSSGLIIPKYGESTNRGFFLEDGGYYFGRSDYFDLKLTGDIYSRGSWALKPIIGYKKRYKYSGNFNLSYAVTILGTEGAIDYSKTKDFHVNWTHTQDPKARPNSVFSASVNAGSSSFNKYNPTTVNDYLSNTLSSSVSYDLRLGTWGNLTTSARHSQNTTSKQVTLTLPEVAFGINRIYPFKRKGATGPPRWYESIMITYNLNMRNELSTYDSLVFKRDVASRFNNGIKHTIPISGSFKVLKYLTWTNSINYNERWYMKTINEKWIGDTIITNNVPQYGHVRTDTINGFRTARDYSFNSSISTTIYGMKSFSKGPVRAIRHVIRPTVGFSYVPDFGSAAYGYYKTVQIDAKGNTSKYSVFGSGNSFQPLYGAPPAQKSGSVNLSLTNNLEMKVRSLKDTVTGTKKIMLIDNFAINTSYDLTRDSLRWSPISISARTTLFKKIQISYSSVYSPYGLYTMPFRGYTILDFYNSPYYNPTPGQMINTYQYAMNKKLLRFVNAGWTLSMGYELSPNKTKPKNKTKAETPDNKQELQDVESNPKLYIDWDNPWSLHFDYNFNMTSQPVLATNRIQHTIIQTVRASGEISMTEKWKLSMQTGYDFQQKSFAFTQMSVYRNLHCWEMRFNWIPYGTQKSWNFQINAKSTLLQDLKLTRKKDFRDNL